MILEKLEELKSVFNQIASGRQLPPEITTRIEKSSSWVNDCLKDLEITRFPLDAKFMLTDKNTFLDIVIWDWVDQKPYVSNFFDCDKFALAFKLHLSWYFGLNQVGWVLDYKSGHSYNLILFPDSSVLLFEPQTDSLFFISERNKVSYSMKDTYVLI